MYDHCQYLIPCSYGTGTCGWEQISWGREGKWMDWQSYSCAAAFYDGMHAVMFAPVVAGVIGLIRVRGLQKAIQRLWCYHTIYSKVHIIIPRAHSNMLSVYFTSIAKSVWAVVIWRDAGLPLPWQPCITRFIAPLEVRVQVLRELQLAPHTCTMWV